MLQSVNHGLISATLFLLAGAIERRTSTGELRPPGRDGERSAGPRDGPHGHGRDRARGARHSAFAGEFLILAGVFGSGWGWAVAGAAGIVLAAMYMLRLISAVLHRDPGPAVSDSALDLRPAELGIVVPLIACLLALSAWPAAISGNALENSADEPALRELVLPELVPVRGYREPSPDEIRDVLRQLDAMPSGSMTAADFQHTPAFAPGFRDVSIVVTSWELRFSR